jgi:ribose transport system permease protein
MVQDGHSLPISLAAAFALTAAFGLVNGWLIAYAEVPSLFTTLASGLFLAGLGQAALFKLDVVQWSPGLDGFERLGQGNLLGIPMSIKILHSMLPSVDAGLTDLFRTFSGTPC